MLNGALLLSGSFLPGSGCCDQIQIPSNLPANQFFSQPFHQKSDGANCSPQPIVQRPCTLPGPVRPRRDMPQAAAAAAAVSSSAATVHQCRILAFAEFKEGSFQLEPSEIPFQPL